MLFRSTDAEGRLVLADALTYAEEDLGATAIVDLATLTGGVVVALGHFCAGWFCNHDELSRSIESASAQAGERLWKLPLWKEHQDFMRGQHADLINSNPQRSAHPIQGAAFLSHFVKPETPWAHIDIAGVGNVDGPTDLRHGPHRLGRPPAHRLGRGRGAVTAAFLPEIPTTGCRSPAFRCMM